LLFCIDKVGLQRKSSVLDRDTVYGIRTNGAVLALLGNISVSIPQPLCFITHIAPNPITIPRAAFFFLLIFKSHTIRIGSSPKTQSINALKAEDASVDFTAT
jgi:hypothetical protein